MPDLRVTTSPEKKPGGKGAGKGVPTKAGAGKPPATAERKTISKPTAQARRAVTPEERWRMVAEAAYLKAEKRGFSGGNPTDDWLAAEAEIDKILSQP